MTDGAGYPRQHDERPGMSKGGAGDVLTGVIAALIGQKLPAFEASQLGTTSTGSQETSPATTTARSA